MTRIDRRRLLVVEDDPQILEALSRRLSRAGYEVMTAAGGSKAIRLIEQFEFDAITLDVRLPDIDGLEVAEKIRQRLDMQFTPIIFITAKVDKYFKEMCNMLGDAHFLRKPYDSDVLLTLLETELEKQRQCAPSKS